MDNGYYTVKFDSLLLKEAVVEGDSILPPLRREAEESSDSDSSDLGGSSYARGMTAAQCPETRKVSGEDQGVHDRARQETQALPSEYCSNHKLPDNGSWRLGWIPLPHCGGGLLVTELLRAHRRRPDNWVFVVCRKEWLS